MSTDQVKKITVVTDNLSLAQARRHIAGCAIARGIRVLSFDERPTRLTTELDVTVSGHPRRIRVFHDDIRGDAWSAYSSGNLVDAIVTPLFVEGFRAARRKWQGRNDPPLDSEVDQGAPRTTVYWKWEDHGSDGEAIGPVWVDTYTDGQTQPVKSDECPHWARRSEALAYAREHGFAFFPDE